MDLDLVVALWAVGYSKAQISRYAGVTPAAVTQAIRRACTGDLPRFITRPIKGEKRQALYVRATALERQVMWFALAASQSSELRRLADRVLAAKTAADYSLTKRLARWLSPRDMPVNLLPGTVLTTGLLSEIAKAGKF